MWKAILILSLALIAAGLGNICLRKGMLLIGPLDTLQISLLWNYFVGVLMNPWIIAGILLELVYFLLWLAVLSWADVSWGLPMHAMEYIFVAVLAQFLLGEEVPLIRWVGVGLISVGILFMIKSWNTTTERLEREIEHVTD
ncbi:MAG: hypothetical protein HY877_06080 [Deltaproteobacteria bacterium]|nr:hypothetical protein [Deltaproteobacteria bacterium]